jgi:hypothetical protein
MQKAARGFIGRGCWSDGVVEHWSNGLLDQWINGGATGAGLTSGRRGAVLRERR